MSTGLIIFCIVAIVVMAVAYILLTNNDWRL